LSSAFIAVILLDDRIQELTLSVSISVTYTVFKRVVCGSIRVRGSRLFSYRV